MANTIVFDYHKMSNAVDALKTLAADYAKAATDLQTAYTTAIQGWTGASQEQMTAFMQKNFKEYTVDYVPSMITALMEVLQANIDQMGGTDAQIAQGIADCTGGSTT